MFFTRIPVPSLPNFQASEMAGVAKFLPAIGLLVGGIQACVLLAAGLVLPPLAAALLALAAALLATGALHEDGLADSFDGLGGGSTREKILEIMKDSRIGSFGAVALVLSLGLQAVALAALLPLPAWMVAVAVLAAHSGSRLAAITLLVTQDYLRADAASRAGPLAGRMRWRGVAVGACAVLPAVLLPWPMLVAGALAMLLMRLWWGHVCARRLGGHTGDLLGACQQLCFTAGLLGLVAAA